MKTEKIIGTRTIQIDDTVTTITCDLCGNVMPTKHTCYICGRDVCEKCESYDPMDMSDYPSRYCKECWDIGKIYREKIQILQTECDEKIENLNISWKNKAKNAAMQKA